MQKIIPETTNFVDQLYRKANAYFASQPNGHYATSFGVAKSIFFILLYTGCYCYFLLGNHDFSSLLVSAGLLGIGHVLLPVNVGHDAIHGTLSSKSWVNQLGLYSIELTGASSFMYSRKHLEAHGNKEQGYKVNTIEAQGLLLQKAQKDKVVNLPYLFYLLYAEYMILVRDFQLFYSEDKSIPLRAWVTLFVSKLAYAFAF